MLGAEDLGAEVVAVERDGARERVLGPLWVEAERVDARVPDMHRDAREALVELLAEERRHPPVDRAHRVAEEAPDERSDPAREAAEVGETREGEGRRVVQVRPG